MALQDQSRSHCINRSSKVRKRNLKKNHRSSPRQTSQSSHTAVTGIFSSAHSFGMYFQLHYIPKLPVRTVKMQVFHIWSLDGIISLISSLLIFIFSFPLHAAKWELYNASGNHVKHPEMKWQLVCNSQLWAVQFLSWSFFFFFLQSFCNTAWQTQPEKVQGKTASFMNGKGKS